MDPLIEFLFFLGTLSFGGLVFLNAMEALRRKHEREKGAAFFSGTHGDITIDQLVTRIQAKTTSEDFLIGALTAYKHYEDAKARLPPGVLLPLPPLTFKKND